MKSAPRNKKDKPCVKLDSLNPNESFISDFYSLVGMQDHRLVVLEHPEEEHTLDGHSEDHGDETDE